MNYCITITHKRFITIIIIITPKRVKNFFLQNFTFYAFWSISTTSITKCFVTNIKDAFKSIIKFFVIAWFWIIECFLINYQIGTLLSVIKCFDKIIKCSVKNDQWSVKNHQMLYQLFNGLSIIKCFINYYMVSIYPSICYLSLSFYWLPKVIMKCLKS